MLLLAIPNISHGRDGATVGAIGERFQVPDVRLLDVHRDPDHNRSVFTVAGDGAALVRAVTAGAGEALRRIDLRQHQGLHPHVGVLDVAPVVFLSDADRGSAIAAALVLADTLGSELGLSVFLYGELGGGRTRAELRSGGPAALIDSVKAGLRPDFGPAEVDPRIGATLVTARGPLIAFNVELAPPATVQDAKRIAAAVRESGEDGLPGVRAIGLWLDARHRAQVSLNIEDFMRASPANALAAIEAHAPVPECELIGLAPRAAFADFPTDRVPVRNLRLLEDVL